MAKAEVIQKSGKYYRFSNVLYQKYEQIDMFVDIWILVTTAETFEDIDELNKLQERSNDIESFYINLESEESSKEEKAPEFILFHDIKYLLNGFARTVWYTS